MADPIFDGVSFVCPCCGRVASVADSDPPVVLHPLPTCARYDAIETLQDAADYMREARAQQHPETFS
jgi:hypothetical protein